MFAMIDFDWSWNLNQVRKCLGPGGSVVKNPPANAGDRGDTDLIPRWGRCPGVGNGNLLQYSCLENYMDRGVVGCRLWGHTESDTTEAI